MINYITLTIEDIFVLSIFSFIKYEAASLTKLLSYHFWKKKEKFWIYWIAF